jgi:molecular chaperone GrpE
MENTAEDQDFKGDTQATEAVDAETRAEVEDGNEFDTAVKKAEGAMNYEKEYLASKDQYVRLYAEFENFRKRTARESFELMANANCKLIGKLTDVLDNFHLAFDPKHKTDKLEDFEKGIRLIFNKFKDILEDEGLEAIDPVGAEFDPNLHEALMQQPSDTIEENKVVSVLQKGYKVKTKIVKHAKVIVSTGKAE